MSKKTENTGLHLLKRSRKGLLHAVFSRTAIITVLLLLQLAVLFVLLFRFENYLPHYFGGTVVFIVLVVLHMLNSQENPTSKITWLSVISLLPVFGSLLYVYAQLDIGHRALKQSFGRIVNITKDHLIHDDAVKQSVAAENAGVASLAEYINRNGCFPVYRNTSVTYFPLGENKFEEMLVQLERARSFIFMEYFIIEEGVMWGKILEILARKAREGVDVRVMYDGTCEFALLPRNYPKRLQQLGIQCKTFAPVLPFVSTHYNNRDHRKILVIDGHTAFTGGINLADEYINHTVKHGHWKDTAVMLRGEAVKSFTLMFLQMWNIGIKNPDITRFLSYPPCTPDNTKGYVIPYGDCPVDNDRVGERVYMDILNRSQKYVHIMTPYLILDGEMETALRFAAERGVEVALILPGIPDKRVPYALAKTHYKGLLQSGVKIFEYTPGFVHAKVFVADDHEAVVGTINLDYRSLYHHFECAAYMYDTPCIRAIETDFQDTLLQCRQVTLQTVKKEKLLTKLVGAFAKIVAPLL